MGLIRQFFQTASIDMKSQKAPLNLKILRFCENERNRGKIF